MSRVMSVSQYQAFMLIYDRPHQNPDRSDAALESMQRYHDQLVWLETKIPTSEIQIPFKWKDAFDRGSIFGGRISLTVSSLGYEKVD